MKMLYILNVASRVNNFCMSSILAAKNLNIEYHIAGNWGYANDTERVADEKKYGVHIHQIDFIRSPLDFRNYKAYKQLKEIVSREKYDVIHCNTPIGGLLGRLVGRKYKVKKNIYQAHGFHFYKGAPLLNWLIYYPIEKWLARYTDMLITINQEDYELAKAKMRLKKGGKVYYVPGVGIDAERISNTAFDCDAKRRELGIMPGKIALLSVGELNDNKNHETVIRAISRLHNNENIIYIICGKGDKEKYLKNLADELGVNLVLAGFRGDVVEICKACDIFVFPSKREGLSVSLMEAMAAGLPCVVSEIRGNVDLVKQKRNGFLCKPSDVEGFAESIKVLATDEELRKKMSQNNIVDIKNFDIVNVVDKMTEIYRELM